MKKNVGSLDRGLRLVAGLGLIGWAAFASGPVWAWFGVVPLGTALLGWCPPYALLGISTCRTKP